MNILKFKEKKETGKFSLCLKETTPFHYGMTNTVDFFILNLDKEDVDYLYEKYMPSEIKVKKLEIEKLSSELNKLILEVNKLEK